MSRTPDMVHVLQTEGIIVPAVERDLLHARFGKEVEEVNAFCGEVTISLLSDDVVVVDGARCVPA